MPRCPRTNKKIHHYVASIQRSKGLDQCSYKASGFYGVETVIIPQEFIEFELSRF